MKSLTKFSWDSKNIIENFIQRHTFKFITVLNNYGMVWYGIYFQYSDNQTLQSINIATQTQ